MLTLIRCPFHPPVTTVARKRPRSLCQKCRWQVGPNHAYTHAQQSRSGLTMPLFRQSGNTSGNGLTRNSSGNTRSQPSKLAEPMWTDPGLKSGMSLHELISTKTIFFKAQAGTELSNILPNSRTRGKSHHKPSPPHLHCMLSSITAKRNP